MANGRAAVRKVDCEGCFFHQNDLCAVSCPRPCVAYRPDHPDGLRPPRQTRMIFIQERKQQVAWMFPTAQEQVALYT